MDIMRSVINSNDAPAPVGPYSHAVICKGLVFCSGQLGLDPSTGRLVEGGIEEQTRCSLQNIESILRSAGSDLSMVLRLTVYVTDLRDFRTVNSVFSEYFSEGPPSRSTVQVAALPMGGRIEIDAIAEIR